MSSIKSTNTRLDRNGEGKNIPADQTLARSGCKKKRREGNDRATVHQKRTQMDGVVGG